MCRWLAYSGSPIRMDHLLLRPKHSLIDQSLNSRMGATTTNGDGFGVGWYSIGREPGVFRSTDPAWNDRNLRSISRHLVSGLVFAHVRASTGGAIQQTNCHPFQFANWLWMHNGLIREFSKVRRDLSLAVDPAYFPNMEGSTDSELFFHLALTFGLRDDPVRAVEQAVGLIEHVGHKHGVENPIQMTVATTDGVRVWSFRYSSERSSRTLFFSTDVTTLRKQYPNNPQLYEVSDETRLIVSEPFGELAGAWNEVPESSWGVVQDGQDEIWSFKPHLPTA